MSIAEIIEKTVSTLNKLPENKGEQVADFADFLLKKTGEYLPEGIHYDKDATNALKIDQVQTDKKIYLFNNPVFFQINIEGDSFLIENEQLDIFAAGLSMEEAKTELSNQFDYSYNLYNELKDEQLSSQLLKVKTFYNLIVKKTIDK